MNGNEFKKWRESKGWTQSDLMNELEVKSRQTIINWESAAELPRVLVLAVRAIDELPDARKSGSTGFRVSDSDAARNREIAMRLSRE